jgi:hypothetical protein
LAPGDEELADAVRRQPAAVGVVVHDDVLALRYALALAHLDARLRLVVTIFDRTIADRVRVLLPQAVVTSAADIAAPVLAGSCLGSTQRRIPREGGGSDRCHCDRTTSVLGFCSRDSSDCWASWSSTSDG